MPAFLSIILMICGFMSVNSLESAGEILCKISDFKKNGSEFCCKLKIDVTPGWKISGRPRIKVRELQGNGEAIVSNLKSEGKKYIAEIKAKNMSKNAHIHIHINIECPICSHVCTIASKNFKLDCTSGKLTSVDETASASKNDGEGRSGATDNGSNGNFNTDTTVIGGAIFLHMLFAFLGGILLNFMPCVLPVIFLKLKSFTSKNALFGSICGNYFCFMAFATAVFALKSQEKAMGWGTHFQDPRFLAVTAFLLFILMVFSFLNTNLSIKTDFFRKIHSAFLFHFFSGVVSAVIAIPCTAPFLGIALTFAMQGSVADLFGIFFATATGFSFFYFVALFYKPHMPNSLRRLGPWVQKLANIGIVLAFLWICFLLFQNLSAKKNGINFTKVEATIAKEISAERVVILNISADWCVNCKYNKARILCNPQIQKLIKAGKVQYIELDITTKNEQIFDFIRSHKRIGIPFTMVYGPKAHKGILLSEIFSMEEILEAIKKSGYSEDGSIAENE